MSALPSTTDRVANNTDEEINRRIYRQTEQSIAYFAEHPDEIAVRLDELDREWDVERVLEANASALAFAGTTLGLAVHRRFFILPAFVSAFLLQHALQGWCPPIPVLRRLGLRTASEIERERYALKHLRGDFTQQPAKDASAWERARQTLAAVARGGSRGPKR